MEQRVQTSLNKIDEAAGDMQRDLEKHHIRKLQRHMFLQSAGCCENTSATAEQVQECIRNSQTPLTKVQGIIKQELEEFQQRLQRCMMTCQDRAKDQMATSGQAEVEKKFADCMCVCADDHLKLIPLMKMRLETAMPKH
uniref:Protein FAM136A n=1 Tax=Phallusia mammillata TaxID=59560 RepID=A0A6F9DCZ3_9ASCI|nr:protein FAM136A [Phallusia mammillata]